MYMVKEVCPGVYAIQDDNVRMYLICGSQRALLLDSAYGGGGVKAFLNTLYDGPILLAHTHAHFDHVGGDGEFEEVWAHPGEWPELMRAGVPEERLRALREGDVIDLGDRHITVYETPGHSPGSLCFADEANRLIFIGDNVSDAVIWMCMPGADMERYRKSVEWLLTQREKFDVYLGCHGQTEQHGENIRAVLDCLDAMEKGEAAMELSNAYDDVWFKLYTHGGASIYRPLDD